MEKIVIYGATHTGITLAKMLLKTSSQVMLLSNSICHDDTLKQHFIHSIDYHHGDVYYVVFDDDSLNVKISLMLRGKNKNAKIFAMLSQDSLGNKVKKHISYFEFINPASMASKKFVDAVLEEPMIKKNSSTYGIKDIKTSFKADPLIKKASIFIFSLMFISTIFFSFHDKMNFLDALYFTVTMMATVGFGDFSLKDAGTLSKIVGILVMLLSVTGTAIIFALVSDALIRKRSEIILGIKKYKGSDHVIVVGGGSVGYRVIEELLSRNEKPVLIDRNMNGAFVKDITDLGVQFIIGDAKNEKILIDAGLERAKGLISVTQDDLVNLEVGLDVKTLDPGMKLVVRIYDQDLSATLRNDMQIKSYSMSYIAAEKLLSMK